MPTYIYEIIDENGNSTEEFIEKYQSMKEEALKEIEIDGNLYKIRRVVTGGVGTIFTGDGWTISDSTRGYKGKFKNKIRPRGSTVDAPANKAEADRQFQSYVDNGGLSGIAPSVNLKTQTTEQQLDKKYTPK